MGTAHLRAANSSTRLNGSGSLSCYGHTFPLFESESKKCIISENLVGALESIKKCECSSVAKGVFKHVNFAIVAFVLTIISKVPSFPSES